MKFGFPIKIALSLAFLRGRSSLQSASEALSIRKIVNWCASLSEDALRTGEEIETQYRVLLPDGRVRWVTRRGRVEFDADGKPFRERGVLMDITKRKQAELEAARQRNELAHLFRVTTMGELSGSLAHELNRPLGAILSNAQAAQRMLANGGVDVAEFREILNDIVSENKHAAEVIRRLRLWLQKGEVQQHSLRINKVVRDVLKLIRTDLISQNVSVDTELARNLPTVTGDPVQLQQVLVNLMVNACDAMADCDTRSAGCTFVRDSRTVPAQ